MRPPDKEPAAEVGPAVEAPRAESAGGGADEDEARLHELRKMHESSQAPSAP